jgi:phosphate transport system ATP-binding protein
MMVRPRPVSIVPPPVRHIVVDRRPHVASSLPPATDSRAAATPFAATSRRVARPPNVAPIERMRVESLSLAYGDRRVVHDVSLPVRSGEVLALMGPSDSGKTTLLRCLNRLTEEIAGARRAGRITLDGEEIHELEVNALRRRVTMVIPEPFPLSIFENIAYALGEPDKPHSTGFFGRHRARRDRCNRRNRLEPAAREALRRADLHDEVADDLDRPARSLSPVQQQRLCIARALAVDPAVVLLDEPCCTLDPISTATIEELIVGLRERMAIVVATHDPAHARHVADQVAFLHFGKVVEYGTAEQVFARPQDIRTCEYVSECFERAAHDPLLTATARRAGASSGRPPRSRRRRWPCWR